MLIKCAFVSEVCLWGGRLATNASRHALGPYVEPPRITPAEAVEGCVVYLPTCTWHPWICSLGANYLAFLGYTCAQLLQCRRRVSNREKERGQPRTRKLSMC